ncbi:hypothetical protein [Rhizobium sp. BR 362]|uniref:hypothetical protein n=1 Tax=Rhizobium sp. BR 362 TaxID=3040670 RepID=UPI002F3EC579
MSDGHAAQCNDSALKGKRNGRKIEQKVHISACSSFSATHFTALLTSTNERQNVPLFATTLQLRHNAAQILPLNGKRPILLKIGRNLAAYRHFACGLVSINLKDFGETTLNLRRDFVASDKPSRRRA